MNYLWFDCETTGLDAIKNDVVQVAFIPVINGVEKNAFNQHCQPIDWNNIDPTALQINGLTIDKLKTFQTPHELVDKLVKAVKQYDVKFTLAGYNVPFDRGFLSSLFTKVGREDDFVALFNPDIHDVLKRAKAVKDQIASTNLKLATLAAYFNIPINAHDALSDISATIKVDEKISIILGDTDNVEMDEAVSTDGLSFKEPFHLHCHSVFSHTDSVPHVKEWVEWAILNNVPGFSLVDHGNAASFFEITRIKDVVKDINKKNSKNYDLDKLPVGVPGVGLTVDLKGSVFSLNAWAISNTGYYNLLKLSSVGWSNRILDSNIEVPIVKYDDLVKYKEGVVFGSSGVNGVLNSFLKTNSQQDLLTGVSNIETMVKDLDFRFELVAVDVTKHYDSDIGFRGFKIKGGNAQKTLNNLYYKLSKKMKVKCVPTCEAHFIEDYDKIIQDCISKNSYKDGRYFYETRKQLNSVEMYAVLKRHISELSETEYGELIDETFAIGNAAKEIKIKNEYHLPKIEMPDDVLAKTDDYNQQTYYLMMKKIKEHGRWNDSPEYVDRFKKEVDVIMKNATLNFLPYFLVYEDICSYARSQGMLQNIARGSAGGSLLSYYLKIIHVDPIKAHLPFERFLSHARIRAGSFPDIDLDIADKARPLVMKYLQDKYGLGFAQIATFNKMKTKNAIKDAMFALYGKNRNDPQVKSICDSIPDSPQGVDEHGFLYGYTDQEGVDHDGQMQTNPDLKLFFESRPEIEKMVNRLIGSIRGWSRHASAFVISTLDLASSRVPTMIMDDPNLGQINVTQFDAAMVEKSGLVKADILGIKTLSMVTDAIKLIKTNYGVDYLEEERGVPAIYRLPDRDEGVFTDFYNANTDSTFQFNSDIIKSAAKEFAPLCREDLALMTALYRPGAMDAQSEFVKAGSTSKVLGKDGRAETLAATEVYVKARNGEFAPYYIHDDLKPYVEDTLGIIVFQEQVMAILVGICGYTLEETDIIRSAIAKKKHEVIMATFDRIRSETKKRGWQPEQADLLCQTIMAFSRYSFNRSHSYAYAELGYITLYLKNHYPLEWWCSVLNNDDNEDKIRKYISNLADRVTSPSVATPSESFAVVNDKIVAPISAIKGVGPAVVKELVAKGPFTSLEDYIERVDHSRVNIGAVSALIKGRAFDCFMDKSIPEYIDQRKVLMDKYCSLRKSKTSFKPEMFDVNAIDIFFHERDTNKCFNKELLNQVDIQKILMGKWPSLKLTRNSKIPMVKGKDTPVIASIKVAEDLVKKDFDKNIAMILVFEESHFTSGTSKKGREWKKVSAKLSDGYSTIECVVWDAEKAFGWPKNSIICVEGVLKPGWKTPVQLVVSEIEPIKDF